jgi:hypothetical protein
MSYKPSDVYSKYFCAQNGSAQWHLFQGLSVSVRLNQIPYFKTKEALEEFEKRVKEAMEKDAENKQTIRVLHKSRHSASQHVSSVVEKQEFNRRVVAHWCKTTVFSFNY